ncbi:alpha/beta fold hydrolase [Streptomyces ipomoeae]|uniref:alpha/beta fold hydrolase n=1 Tax=Streptomyces ipomoeae TaxID=103232 RepID=UPI00114696D4|nr:alpha/beta hydrolase [Streptomyces ipomoeae]MDX2932825.1 alpha/beta hydrolase [Streptomyces ipomoeae]TQE26043.1 alpha/beta hydrolase [Streptomyces ipomoeae]
MECMVKVDGGEVWADDSGAAAGEGVPPVVLVHPGVGDSRVWEPVLPGLVGRYRVIRYDARGFGGSPKPETSYTQVQDLAAVLDHFDVRRAVLVGSSMGGSTSISLALDDPDRVAALGLLVPGVSGYPALESAELAEKIPKLAAAGDMDGLVALALRVWGAAGTDPDTAATESLRAAIPAWFTTYGHETPAVPAFDRLGELTMPCTLLLGEKDQPEVVRCNEAMAARIPGCHLVRLPDSDHFPTLRAPEAVVRVVTDLVDRLGAEKNG